MIFLDFDGVLRREGSPLYRLERHLVANLESVVLASPETNVVITSSWREVYGLSELKGLFSSEFAQRIEGLTPIARIRDDHYRYKEVLAYLKQRQEDAAWIAIDDDPLHYPPNAPVLLTDPGKGFDELAATRLARILLGAV